MAPCMLEKSCELLVLCGVFNRADPTRYWWKFLQAKCCDKARGLRRCRTFIESAAIRALLVGASLTFNQLHLQGPK